VANSSLAATEVIAGTPERQVVDLDAVLTAAGTGAGHFLEVSWPTPRAAFHDAGVTAGGALSSGVFMGGVRTAALPDFSGSAFPGELAVRQAVESVLVDANGLPGSDGASMVSVIVEEDATVAGKFRVTVLHPSGDIP